MYPAALLQHEQSNGYLCTLQQQVYRQGGKELREHRFLACLERKYSDSVKL